MTKFQCPSCSASYERPIRPGDKIGFKCDYCSNNFEIHADGGVAPMPALDKAQSAYFTSDDIRERGQAGWIGPSLYP